jgi:hypothetical protein
MNADFGLNHEDTKARRTIFLGAWAVPDEASVILSEAVRRLSRRIPPGKREPAGRGSFDSRLRFEGFAVPSGASEAPRRRLVQDDRSFARVEKTPGHGSDLVKKLSGTLSFRYGDGASDLQEPQVAIHLFG